MFWPLSWSSSFGVDQVPSCHIDGVDGIMGMNRGGLNAFNSGVNRPATTGINPANNQSETSRQEAQDEFHAQFKDTTMKELLEDALWGSTILEFFDMHVNDDEKPVKVRQASGHNMIDYNA